VLLEERGMVFEQGVGEKNIRTLWIIKKTGGRWGVGGMKQKVQGW